MDRMKMETEVIRIKIFTCKQQWKINKIDKLHCGWYVLGLLGCAWQRYPRRGVHGVRGRKCEQKNDIKFICKWKQWADWSSGCILYYC